MEPDRRRNPPVKPLPYPFGGHHPLLKAAAVGLIFPIVFLIVLYGVAALAEVLL